MKRNGRYQVTIRTSEIRFNATVNTREEALELLKAKNIEFELPIKNLIHRVDDHYEVELTQGKRAKFDEEDLELIQNYTWCARKKHRSWYTHTMIGHASTELHRRIMADPPPGHTIDHINRDGLDNRRSNLRHATHRQQGINRNMRITNVSGITGVRRTKNGYWQASWYRTKGKQSTKAFLIAKYGDDTAKQMAIAYRQAIIENLPDYQ